ncbi:MAG: putative lipoprotein [Chlorobi bacterium]|nr:putative lipoprotein [Chlorobiota bacterium]
MNNHSIARFASIIIPILIGVQSMSRAQISFGSPPATPVSKCDFCLAAQGISPLEAGGSGARLDIRYLRLGTVYEGGTREANDEQETEWHLTQQYSVFYGVGPGATLSALIPVARRHSEAIDEQGASVTGDQFGLGDISLIGRYRAIDEHEFTTTTIVSLVGGLKLPTGRTTGTDSRGELLDAHIQLGTGSTDLLFGANYFGAADRFSAAVNLLAGVPTGGANGHRFGPGLNYDATLRYRVYPEIIDTRMFFLGITAAGEHRGREKEEGVIVENSGGGVVYLGPNAQVYLSPSLSFEAAFQYPVAHSLNGRQLGEDYRVMAGGMLLF